DESNGRRELAAIARKAGVGSVSRYDLRHSACSLLSFYGVPNERIADILGHATTRMVDEIYRHPVGGVLRHGVGPAEGLFTEASEARQGYALKDLSGIDIPDAGRLGNAAVGVVDEEAGLALGPVRRQAEVEQRLLDRVVHSADLHDPPGVGTGGDAAAERI